MNVKSYPVVISAILLLVIGYSVVTYSPEPVLYDPPVYNGTLWVNYVPSEFQAYRVISGKLCFNEIESKRGFHTVDGMVYKIVKSTVYTLDTGDEKYHLVDYNHNPVTDNRYNEYLDETVYVQGNYFRLYSEENGFLRMIEPFDISRTPLLDIGERSRDILVDVLGEQYFRTHFTGPMIYIDWGSSDEKYEVVYGYKDEEVYLYFDTGMMMTSQRGIPDSSSRIPYSVTKDEALMIAVENGFVGGLNSTVRVSTYTSPDNWKALEGKVPVETYYNPEYTARVMNLTHYIWNVGYKVKGENDEPTVHHNAYVDVRTGELYLINEFKVYSVGSIWVPSKRTGTD